MRLAVALVSVLFASTIAVPSHAQIAFPEGSGCEAAIGRWQEFAGQENQGGHMGDSVYNKIKSEIAEATEVCRSGQDARASKMVEASMRHHGY